jgi:prevent-host-death family protein
MTRPKSKTAGSTRIGKVGLGPVELGRSLKSGNTPTRVIGLKLQNSRTVVGSVLRQHVPATQAKNLFGQLIKDACNSGPVFIERHGRPQVVLVDFQTYKDLVDTRRTPDERRLEALRVEFDALYAQMQTPAVRKVADIFLSASADELNKAARRRKPRG